MAKSCDGSETLCLSKIDKDWAPHPKGPELSSGRRVFLLRRLNLILNLLSGLVPQVRVRLLDANLG